MSGKEKIENKDYSCIISIEEIYKMVKEYPEDTERDIYQRVTWRLFQVLCKHKKLI